MKSNENAVVYSTEETVNVLNSVRGFNPMKYVRSTEAGAVLDLPYQKLWFRLKHPNGRIRYFIQKLSDSVAAVEARVFFDRRDSEPVANHIVSGVDITDKNAALRKYFIRDLCRVLLKVKCTVFPLQSVLGVMSV